MPGSVNKIFGEMHKQTAITQISLGLIAGAATGYAFTKLGETIAIAIGGGLVLLKVAEQQGYITIHKRNSPSNEGNNLANIWGSVEPEHWYTNLIGDSSGIHINELHLFIVAFSGGVALGVFKLPKHLP